MESLLPSTPFLPEILHDMPPDAVLYTDSDENNMEMDSGEKDVPGESRVRGTR